MTYFFLHWLQKVYDLPGLDFYLYFNRLTGAYYKGD